MYRVAAMSSVVLRLNATATPHRKEPDQEPQWVTACGGTGVSRGDEAGPCDSVGDVSRGDQLAR